MNLRCLSLLLILFPFLAESTQQSANNGNDRISESQAIGQPNKTALQANKEFMRNALFLYTVQYSDLKAVLPWLRKGMNPNIVANQGTQQFVTLVDGAHVERVAAKEITPLFFAIIRCREVGVGYDEQEKRSVIPIIRALLAHGANPNAEVEIKFGFNNYQGIFTPLSLAAYISCNSIIKDLIIAGGDPNGLIDRRVDERQADGPESGKVLEIFSNTPLITTDMHGGGQFVPYINPEPELACRNWLIVRKLLFAGATEDGELIMDILTNALKLYTATQEDWDNEPLPWHRLLPQTQDDVQWLVPWPQDPLTVTIRQELQPYLINDLTDIVLGYATRFWMHPDVEQIIRAKIQEQDNEVQEHKERQGSK